MFYFFQTKVTILYEQIRGEMVFLMDFGLLECLEKQM